MYIQKTIYKTGKLWNTWICSCKKEISIMKFEIDKWNGLLPWEKLNKKIILVQYITQGL